MWLSIVSRVVSEVAEPATAEPPRVTAPLERPDEPDALDENAPALPADGAAPLDAIPPGAPDTGIPADGTAPLGGDPLPPASERHSVPPLAPLAGPPTKPPPPVDPRRVPIVRLDLLSGPIWRLDIADALLITSVEAGRARGFSGSFHTGIMLGRDRDVVRVVELPIGVGGIARTRLRKRPLFASIGLTAGILVHRAATDDGVTHRVDPDFRLPIRLAWTIATVGISLALEQGYSVRKRTYEQRGEQVWARSAYRVGFVLGLHSDIGLSRATMGRAGRRSRSRP